MMAAKKRAESAQNRAMGVQERAVAAPMSWDRLRVVLAVSRGRTLSAAARALDVDHTTVARQLASADAVFGAPLFDRTVAGFAATPLGERVIAAAERMESEVIGLHRQLDAAGEGLEGCVRLTTTPVLASLLFAPSLSRLLNRHPRLQVELLSDARSLDISRREADVAVRFARPESPGLVVRRAGEIAFAWYAASGDPRLFPQQSVLAYDDASAITSLQRYLADLAVSKVVAVRTNTMHALVEATASGLGCSVLPCFAAEHDPRLRRVQVPRAMHPMPIWVVHHEDLKHSPKVRALIDFVEQVIAEHRDDLLPAGFPFDAVPGERKAGRSR